MRYGFIAMQEWWKGEEDEEGQAVEFPFFSFFPFFSNTQAFVSHLSQGCAKRCLIIIQLWMLDHEPFHLAVHFCLFKSKYPVVFKSTFSFGGIFASSWSYVALKWSIVAFQVADWEKQVSLMSHYCTLCMWRTWSVFCFFPLIQPE